jgi:hypothetical protein
VDFIDLFVVCLTLITLVLCAIAVWKIGGLKSDFIEERSDRIRQVLSEVGRVETIGEAGVRASVIIEAMQRHDVAGLILPLSSGGRVKFRLSDSILKIERG